MLYTKIALFIGLPQAGRQITTETIELFFIAMRFHRTLCREKSRLYLDVI